VSYIPRGPGYNTEASHELSSDGGRHLGLSYKLGLGCEVSVFWPG